MTIFDDPVLVLEFILGLAGAIFIFSAAILKLTSISALTQMGSIQARAASWSDLTKPKQKQKQEEEQEGETVEKKNEKVASSSSLTKTQPKPKKEKTAEEMVQSVKIKDQMVYTFTFVNLILSAYIGGAYPQYFHLTYTLKFVLYISHRAYHFWVEKQYPLFADLCYWANILILWYLYFDPHNAKLFQICFTVCNGPVAFAILSFGQSLIPHSIVHLTSIAIHLIPAMLLYIIKWRLAAVPHRPGDPLPQYVVCGSLEEGTANDCVADNPSAVTMLWNALSGFYLWWLAIYYVVIYCVLDKFIRERGLKTLFDRIISKGPTKKISSLSDNEFVQKSIYMIIHLCFSSLTMSLAKAYWRFEVLNFIFIVCLIAASSWNGSTYIWSVFLNSYQNDVYKKAGVEIDPKTAMLVPSPHVKNKSSSSSSFSSEAATSVEKAAESKKKK